MTYTATYSPEDNKLRLYASARLPEEVWARLKAAGFRWAPKQELFVAPAWTPGREDMLIELAGEIGDEDTSLVERAEAKAERLEALSGRKVQEARNTQKAVDSLADGIPLGQPILIGHHSEKRARKDAEKIRNGMNKTVTLFKEAQYWIDRAEGAIGLAKYKELPAVRARRIKILGAELRKIEREKKDCGAKLAAWTLVRNMTDPEAQAAAALRLANVCWLHLPRKEGDKPDFNQCPTAYDALTGGFPNLYAPRTLQEVLDHAVKAYVVPVGGRTDRWIAHLENRIAYETAMLNEAGAGKLLEPKPRKKQVPILNYRAEGNAITTENPWRKGETITYPQVSMSKAEYAKVYTTFCRLGPDKAHRIRLAVMPGQKVVSVFLTDQKEHPPQNAAPVIPEPTSEAWSGTVEEAETFIADQLQDSMAAIVDPPTEILTELPEQSMAQDFKDACLRGELAAAEARAKAGVQVAVAPQLFPTPADVAHRMVCYAGLEKGDMILEPSAGTGALVSAALQVHAERGWGGVYVTAIERNVMLADRLARTMPAVQVICADFLDAIPDPRNLKDKVLMNPPFENGADIKHIRHAMRFLKPGGRLVAICANGPRQRDAFREHECLEHWEDLPDGTFKAQGTNVRTALMVLVNN